MIVVASAIIRSINSRQVGTSWISPATIPQDQAPASISPTLHDRRIDAGHFGDDVLELEARSQGLLFLDQAFDPGVDQHPLGVAQRPHDEAGIEFARRHQGLLDVLMDRSLHGRHEAGAHVHAFGSQ